MKEASQIIQSQFYVSQNKAEELSGYFIEEKLTKGDFFCKAGLPCNKLSLIKSGYIRIFTDINQKEVTQWISFDGYFITDLRGFFFDDISRWHMKALSNCQLLTLTKESYRKLRYEVKDWMEIERNFMAKCFETLETRVFSHLAMDAEERYKQLFNYYPELFNAVPLQYLASMIGVSPETFSRIRARISN